MRLKHLLWLAPLAPLGLLAGCAPPASAPAAPLNSASGGAQRLSRLIAPYHETRASLAIASPLPAGRPLQSLGAEPAATAPEPAVPSAANPSGSVSLNFADADIRAVVAQILGKILGVTYTIDPAVTGRATLHTAGPVPVSQMLPVLEALLAENHAELTASGGIYRVVPLSGGAGSPALSGGAGLGGATVVPLRYVSAAHLAQVLQPYIGKEGRVVASPAGNAVLVDGTEQTRSTLVSLVQAFDVDTLSGQSYALLPVAGDSAPAIATALSTALNPTKGEARLHVVPLDRIRAVLVIAPSPGELREAERAYQVLAVQALRSRRVWHVYYLRNSGAGQVAHVLQEAFTPNDVTAEPSEPGATQGGQGAAGFGAAASGMGGAGGFGAAGSGIGGSGIGGSTLGGSGIGGSGAGGSGVLGNSSLLGNSGLVGGTSADPAAAPRGASSDTAGANPLLGPLGGAGQASGSGGETNGTRILADAQQNAVLVYATADENATIRTMLHALDVQPMEVEIDATIAEVTLNAALQYGTQFFFKSGGINAVLSQASSSNLALNFPGFVLSGHGSDAAPLAISALQTVTKVRVLSSPQLLVQNDRTANLLVGNLVPYLSQTAQSTITAGAPVVNSINYQETGVILQITPRISDDGLVTLQISQQVSAVNPTITTQGIDSPTFSERAVSSSVVVHDGQTIGLAGLITDQDQRENSGLPFIKNVPVLGSLFSSQNNQRSRTELLVLLTPHVVRNDSDAVSLTEDLRDALPAASAVPAALTGEPFMGSDDPNAQLGEPRSRPGYGN